MNTILKAIPIGWSRIRLCLAVGSLLATDLCLGAERLDRGVVAFPQKDGGVYVGWRRLAGDPASVSFEVYRLASPDGERTRINREPIVSSTNLIDPQPASPAARYVVRALAGGRQLDESDPIAIDELADVGGFRRLKLAGDHRAQKVGVADLDGDGRLDFIVKQPEDNVDPWVQDSGPVKGYWFKSVTTVKIEAYRHDGTMLWRHDLGWGIESGIWFSPILVYDIDGDGRAEVYCKAGPEGDPRTPSGMVTSGPEYLVKFDGATGRELARLDWPSREGITRHRSHTLEYNNYSRNLLGVAYLDGERPHLIVQRGTYTEIKLRAYDPQLKQVWEVEVGQKDDPQGYPTFRGAGSHGLQIADLDADGRDEIVIGAAAIDHDGRPLWSTGRGHPDACYVGDIDPSHPGLEVFYGHEWRHDANGVCLVEAATGRTLWGYQGKTYHVHSQGLVADIDPTHPGMECYAGETGGSQFWLYSSRGERIGEAPIGGLAPVAVWWEAGPTKAVLARGRLFRFRPQIETVADPIIPRDERGLPVRRMGPALDPDFIDHEFGPIEGKVVAIGDFLGDWREELVVSLPGELRIYSTTIPTERRGVCLLQDRQYRTAVACQLMGYLYPPIVGGIPLPDERASNNPRKP